MPRMNGLEFVTDGGLQLLGFWFRLVTRVVLKYSDMSA
jgi:hypothetical protein